MWTWVYSIEYSPHKTPEAMRRNNLELTNLQARLVLPAEELGQYQNGGEYDSEYPSCNSFTTHSVHRCHQKSLKQFGAGSA
jgi:hypothetical protein